MLYEQWLEIAAAFRDRIGLRDLAVGNKWTFGEIAALIQQITPSKEKILFPQGGSAEFIFTVLRAWRDQQVICPLEEGQSAQLVDSVPPGIVHLKTTSATTGASRLVAFLPEQLRADADNIVQTMGLNIQSPNLGGELLLERFDFFGLASALRLRDLILQKDFSFRDLRLESRIDFGELLFLIVRQRNDRRIFRQTFHREFIG